MSMKTTHICCQWYSLSCEVNITILWNLHLPLWTWQFPATKDISNEISGDTDERALLILNDKMCQHWENLDNSATCIFHLDKACYEILVG